MKFVDETKLELVAGNGGHGCMSFRRERFLPKGGPDGGDGGKGGSIYAIACDNINTLIDYRYKRVITAASGEHGRGADQYGRSADDIILEFPVGTLIFDEDNDQLLFDLNRAGQKVLLVEGGKGGLGNLHFKSSINRAPRQATDGEPGQRKHIRLELKLLADVGLLGFPNAGKSSLITALSNAKPKVADYPFTTLYPNLGVVKVDEGAHFVIADIPGLIEGASEGLGLGHLFLRHLSRTRLLLHLVDLTILNQEEDLTKNITILTEELQKYSDDLAKKPRWLLFNKKDAFAEESDYLPTVQATLDQLNWNQPYAIISALDHKTCEKLVQGVYQFLHSTKL